MGFALDLFTASASTGRMWLDLRGSHEDFLFSRRMSHRWQSDPNNSHGSVIQGPLYSQPFVLSDDTRVYASSLVQWV